MSDRTRGLVPFQKGHTHSMTHGGSPAAAWRLAPRAAELAEGIRALVPAYAPADEPLIQLCAMTMARIESMAEYVARLGPLDSRGRPRGVLRVLQSAENGCARMLSELGCSPTSRARLGLDVARAGVALEEHLEKRYGVKKDV
jgi:hypothetical protein